MSSIFSKIVEGVIPCYKVAEDNRHLAFLDINPVTRGHVLVIPKLEVDRFFDLPEEDYLQLMQFVKSVSKAIKKTFSCDRVGMTVVGLDVPHAHVHLMPINSLSDMDLTKPKRPLSKDQMISIAEAISKNFSL